MVGQVWARKGAHRYLVHQVRGQWGLPDTILQMIALTCKYPKAVKKLVERAANGPAVEQALRDRVEGIIMYDTGGRSKLARAHEASVYYESGNVWLPETAPWLSDWLAEHASFPRGANDDQVDAGTQALNHDAGGREGYLAALATKVREGGIL